MEYIITEFENSIGTVTFNNDKKANSLNTEMMNEIASAIKEFHLKKARAVVLRAKKGAAVWSAGFDINELPEPGLDPLNYFDPFEQVIREIQNFPAPVIAVLEGSVWGGACNIAFVCDILIGSPTVTFSITPAKIGAPYNPSGLLQFINMVSYHLAKEMFFTAKVLNAEEAKQRGILNQLAANSDELELCLGNYTGQILKSAPLSIAVIKEQMRILANSVSINPDTFERLQDMRRKVYESQDFIEGKKAFQENREPVFKGI